MFLKKSMHFLNNVFKKGLFICESKPIYLSFRNNETRTERVNTKETVKDQMSLNREAIKKLREELAKGKEYKKGFEKYIGKKIFRNTYKKKLTENDTMKMGRDMVGILLNRLPKEKNHKETNNRYNFITPLLEDISKIARSNLNIINRYIPISIQLGPGSVLEFYNDKKKFSLKFDLKLDSPRLQLIQSQLDHLQRSKERKAQVREQIHARTRTQLSGMRQSINPSAEFTNQLMRTSKSPYLKKKGDIFVIDFKGKSRHIDRKAEKQTKIQDILDLSRLNGGNMYVRIHLDGVSPNGVKHKYWAYYHPTQRTFIVEGTTKRARVFHGTKIDKIEYRVATPKKATMPIVAPSRKQKKAPRISESRRRAERLGRIERKNWDNFHRNHAYIFKNKRFYVPRFIQDDDDFKNNWGRIDATLEGSLARPPFNLRSTKARRKYIQDVIQGNSMFDLNSRLYAQDFFETKVNGKNLYKGGYKKFLKDFHSVDKKMARLGMDYLHPRNAEETDLAKKWSKLQSIAFGLASVFNALGRLSIHPKQAETNTDIYRIKFLGIKQISEREMKKLRPLKYHSLQSLLHGKENAPSGIDIGVSNKILTNIKNIVIDNEAPNLNIRKLLKAKGGLKLMFMAFGLNSLIERGCVKKLDGKHYVIVRIPTNGWSNALLTIENNKAKLYDPSRENLKKWEEVRESINNGRRARNFILKIFRPNGSEVKQNINWWKKLWHWDFKNKKKITMAYLGKITLNPSDLEKHVATDRGYWDMMEKTSKRVEGTSLYEPQKEKVLRLSNQYLEYGLLATFMNTSPKNLKDVTNQILRDFDIENKVHLKTPLNKKENRIGNIKEIHRAISLKGLNPAYLTNAHIKMIRMGYVLGRQIETASNWSEVMKDNLSTKPLYRKIQLKALRDGCPIYKLKEVEQRVHLAIFGLSQSMHAPGVHNLNVRGGGGAVAIDLGEWAGQKWHMSVGAAGVDGKFMPFAEVGAAIKLGKKVKLKWSLGTTIGFSGASAAVEFPVTSEWDMYVGAGVGVDWQGKAGIGATIGARWDKLRAERIRETKALKERGVKEIDKLISAGNTERAVALILRNKTFGEYVKALKAKFNLPSSVLVDIYQNARTQWLNAARRGVKIPAVTGFGVGVFAGASVNPGETGVSVGAYITFKIPGTTVNYVIRQEHPKYSEYVQTQIAQETLKKKLLKAGNGRNVISSFVLSANSGVVYFDSRLGRGHIARPNGTSEMRQSIAIRQGREQIANIARKGTLDAIRRTFSNLDMHVEMVPDPKNPKQHLLAISPLQTQGSNVEMLIDPKLKSKGIILDKANNRILLAASEARKLYVTRTKYRYPFARKGAMNLEVIAFKDDLRRSNIEIREDSPHYIYKYKGEKYAMVRGEARTGLSEESSNTITLEQYKKRKARLETFKDKKLEFSLLEGKKLTSKMSDAVGYKEQEPVRFDQLRLKDFADSVLEKHMEAFQKGLVRVDTPEKEAIFKTEVFGRLKDDFKKFAKDILKNPNLSLNEQELNLLYTYMINQSFSKLMSKSEAVINRRLEKRNKLFRAYMKNYINNFKAKYPDKWAEIKAIDPTISPDSIANYLMLTMPQNANQLRAFLGRKGLPIEEGLKFASYTRKYDDKHKAHEAFATSYGTQMPESMKPILEMVNPTKLNINSPDPRERAAARLILQVMSPLSTENLETPQGKKDFLTSELSLLVISMYDEKTGISPMIEVLGKKNYQGMIAIYKALKEGKGLAGAINANSQAFDQFKILVMGIRNAQLNAQPTFVFKNKYIFHLNKTEVYSGPYLKCGNGTIAARQQIGLSIKREQTGQWYGARTARNISVIPNERAGAATMTAGWAHMFKQQNRTPKGEVPNRHRRPPKGEVQNRHSKNTPSHSQVSKGPSNSI